MTLGELLALLGRAWSRLLLYPGGAAAFLAAWLLLARRPAPARRPPPTLADLTALAAPWLALALLPLPGAAQIDAPIDAVLALALLEWPLLLLARHELRGEVDDRARGGLRLAAVLNAYPPLLLALLALTLAAGSFRLDALAAPPGDAPPAVLTTHWAGALGLALALPPLLALGPFRPPGEPARPVAWALRLGIRMRAVGWWALALLPWLTALHDLPFLLPLPPLLLGLWLRWFDGRATGSRRRWAWACLALALVLLLVVVGGAVAALVRRLS